MRRPIAAALLSAARLAAAMALGTVSARAASAARQEGFAGHWSGMTSDKQFREEWRITPRGGSFEIIGEYFQGEVRKGAFKAHDVRVEEGVLRFRGVMSPKPDPNWADASDREARLDGNRLNATWRVGSNSGNYHLERRSTLRDLAVTHDLRIGSVYQGDSDPRYKAVFAREYNVLTVYAGWEVIHNKSRTSYDFTSTDQAVEFAERNGFAIQGQSLVWYYLNPRWVERIPRSQVEEVMNEHIDRVVGRYAGRVKAWNVVNEAVDDAGRDLRRDHVWSRAMGDDYIAKAFLRVHQADPNAVLYYNEASMETNDEDGESRFRVVKGLLRRLLDQRVPVHALGWQMHLRPDFNSSALLARMSEIAEMGLDNYITELDVKLPEQPTPEDYERQKQVYKEVVRIFLQARRRGTLVVWGLRDGLDKDWLSKNHPLPFDARYKKKPAYFGIQEALSR